jgi:hypothetical protein
MAVAPLSELQASEFCMMVSETEADVENSIANDPYRVEAELKSKTQRDTLTT